MFRDGTKCVAMPDSLRSKPKCGVSLIVQGWKGDSSQDFSSDHLVACQAEINAHLPVHTREKVGRTHIRKIAYLCLRHGENCSLGCNPEWSVHSKAHPTTHLCKCQRVSTEWGKNDWGFLLVAPSITAT